VPLGDIASQIILEAHHPELAQRLARSCYRTPAEAACIAATWNVFRTLRLVDPPFWLRRLRARLLGTPLALRPPTQLQVRLWPAPALLDPFGRAGGVDVLVDTDTAVYGLLTLYGADIPISPEGADVVLQAIDATTRYAGVRDSVVGVMTTSSSDSPIAAGLIERYARGTDVLLNRLSHRPDGLTNLHGVGWMTWADMGDLLQDCADADALPELPRFACRLTRQWLAPLAHWRP
jgi:hypothetical protein